MAKGNAMNQEASPTKKSFATTLDYYREHPRLAAAAHIIAVPPALERSSNFILRDEVRFLLRILRTALQYDTLLLYSSRGRLVPELLATVLFGFLPRRFRPQVVFHGEMYEPNPGLRHLVERMLMRLADRAVVRYILYSPAEVEPFANLWGIDKSKVRVAYLPFFGKLKADAPALFPPINEPYIFAGGNSFRDYPALIKAAHLMPDIQFIICTSDLASCTNLPPNVRAGQVSCAEYSKLMREATAVVIPLQCQVRRITGALTYLQAMWLKKPIIVSDALSVRDYIDDGVTGWIVDGSPESYVEAIRWVMDPAHWEEVARVCDQAHQAVDSQFSLDRYVTQLLEVMSEVVELKPTLEEDYVYA
jgi:glycosyltransferase involved in cell wall biosynthesis